MEQQAKWEKIRLPEGSHSWNGLCLPLLHTFKPIDLYCGFRKIMFQHWWMVEKSGEWRWTLSIFHWALVPSLELNKKYQYSQEEIIPWKIPWVVYSFSSGLSEHWRKVSSINQHCFFYRCLSVFLWDGNLITISVLFWTYSVVSTSEIGCCCLSAFSKVQVRNLGIRSEMMIANHKVKRGAI